MVTLSLRSFASVRFILDNTLERIIYITFTYKYKLGILILKINS